MKESDYTIARPSHGARTHSSTDNARFFFKVKIAVKRPRASPLKGYYIIQRERKRAAGEGKSVRF